MPIPVLTPMTVVIPINVDRIAVHIVGREVVFLGALIGVIITKPVTKTMRPFLI